jgi:hypothetical protein
METSNLNGRKLLAGAALIGLLSAGCAGEMKGSGGPVGEVRLALSLPDGTSVNSVSWKILSASSAVIVSGTLNTSGSQRPSFIASLPPATGDTVNMTATTSSGAACAGSSAAFNVVAGQSVTVNVNVPCEGAVADGGIGSVVVSGTIVPGDHCPTLTSWLITPQASGAADPIDVTVSAADLDSGDTLSYAWAAPAGTFTNPSSAATQYHCGPTGSESLSVQVSDNHTPIPCTTSITFPAVDCL